MRGNWRRKTYLDTPFKEFTSEETDYAHARPRTCAPSSGKHHFSDEHRACFQRTLSMVQKTLALRPAARLDAQTSRLRSSSATLRRSTTVMPRVSSLSVSTSTKCADCEDRKST